MRRREGEEGMVGERSKEKWKERNEVEKREVEKEEKEEQQDIEENTREVETETTRSHPSSDKTHCTL